MFTREHRRTRNRRRGYRKPINWAEIASGVFLALFAGSFFAAGLLAIYYGG